MVKEDPNEEYWKRERGDGATPLGPDPITALILTRARTHGDFTEGSKFAETFITIFEDHPTWALLPAFARQSIRMQASKYGRIMAGDWDFADHWNDVSGYSKLVADRCSK